MIAQRRDKNEEGIVDVLLRRGHGWVPMDRMTGFDGLLISKSGPVYIVEIKNPERRWKLTPREIERKAQVEAAGGTYHIILHAQEAIDLAERGAFERNGWV